MISRHTNNKQPFPVGTRVLFEREFELAKTMVNFPLQPEILRNSKFLEAIESLEKLALEERFQPIAPRAINDPRVNLYLEPLRKANEFYEIVLETNQVVEQLTKPSPVIEDTHLARDADTARLEGEAAQITADSHLAFVGSGPFPSTAIALAKVFGCRVTCIDCSIEAIVLSARLLRRMGNLNIDVLWNFGEKVDYKQYTHVLIAALIHNRDVILQRISDSLALEGKVICRHGQGLQQLIYEGLDGKELNGFCNKGYVKDTKNTFTSIILSKTILKT